VVGAGEGNGSNRPRPAARATAPLGAPPLQQLPRPQGLGFGELQVDLQAGIQAESGRGGVGLAADQREAMARAAGIRGDAHRSLAGTAGPGHPAEHVKGIGEHHLHQGQQVLLAALQPRAASPLQHPAGDEARGIAGLADGPIEKPFHLQAAADLVVAEGLFIGWGRTPSSMKK
jgi:hypothetical protein